jgi:hypothetical protein
MRTMAIRGNADTRPQGSGRLAAIASHTNPAKRAAARTASSCKPNQPAYAVRWLVATAALARTVRWPFPEVKPRIPPVSAVRGSRAGTDPRKPQPKGVRMEKTALDLICPLPKSFPLKDLRAHSAQNEAKACKPMISRSYTLCEVVDGIGNRFPSTCRNQGDLPTPAMLGLVHRFPMEGMVGGMQMSNDLLSFAHMHCSTTVKGLHTSWP